MSSAENDILSRLHAMQDVKYGEFTRSLVPTVSPDRIIGVRIPAIRAFAKELAGTAEAAEFMKTLPHKYYEENNLHAFLIEKLRDYNQVIEALDAFLPYVDNWSTCDSMSPKIFKKHLTELLLQIREWLASDSTYTIRFAVEMLMSFYLDDSFSPEYPELVASVKSDEYYVNMMIAWYFATALAKQYDAVLPYLTQKRLAAWTHNKTIRKSIESFRVTDEHKAFLRTLIIK